MSTVKILSRILAIILFIISAIFIASTTPSITGYSVLSGNIVSNAYAYFPFLGTLSFITAFILLLNDSSSESA